VNAESKTTGYNGKVDFLSDGAIEFHWAERDVNTGFKMKQIINPMSRGHFCFRTNDIKGFMRKLDELGIQYSDYGKWAIAGWYQVFLQDSTAARREGIRYRGRLSLPLICRLTSPARHST